jgi:glycerophosphoryl diester phosphodiesterase
MVAFRRAVDDGADGFELDVHASRDNELVVIHDFDLKRTGGVSRRVQEMTCEELAGCDVTSWFAKSRAAEKASDSPAVASGASAIAPEGVPRLRDVLTLAAQHHLWVNVELKAGSRVYPGIERQCIALLHENGLADRAVVSSFDHYALLEIKREDPTVKTGVLHAASLVNAHEYASKLDADALHPNHLVVDPDYVAGCRTGSIEVNAWTVNDPAAAKRLIALGVTSLITDDVPMIRKLLED